MGAIGEHPKQQSESIEDIQNCSNSVIRFQKFVDDCSPFID